MGASWVQSWAQGVGGAQPRSHHLCRGAGPTSRQADKERHKWDVEEGRQELYEALAKGLQGLQKTLYDNEEVQRARTTRCLQLLAQEIRDRWVLPGGREGREGRPGRGNHRWDGGNGRGLSKGVWGALEILGDKRRGWGRQRQWGGGGRLGGQK